MKKQLKPTKLQLTTQTIKLLDDVQLVHVAGAGRNPTNSCRLSCLPVCGG